MEGVRVEAISRLRRLHVHFADLLTEMTWCCPVDGDEDLGCKDMGKGDAALLCSVFLNFSCLYLFFSSSSTCSW